MAYRLTYSDYAGNTASPSPPQPTPAPAGNGYRLRYSDYPGTAEGPPDPLRWVGPPGPQGPPGPAGPASTYTLPTASTTILGGVKIDGTSITISDGTISSAATSGGPFLPLSGGTVSGLVTLSGAGTVLSVPSGLNITSNFQGSGLPAFYDTNRLVFARQTTALGDFCDFQFQRTTTFTGGTQANLNACARFIGTYGAGDGSNNWNIVSQAQTHGTSNGLTVGTFSTAQRLSGATDGVFGGIMNGTDLTGLPSSTSGAQVIGLEVDCQVQDRDDRANTAMFGGTGMRVGIDIAAVRNNPSTTSPPTEITAGVWFTTANKTGVGGGSADAYTNYLSAICFGLNTQTYQALDTRGAIVPTGVTDPLAAVRMSAGHAIDFNGGATLKSAAGNYLQYTTSGTPRLRYMVGASEVWSVSDAGVSTGIPIASSTTPAMDSVAAVGVGTTWARGDHVHPVDTSRYAATNPSGYQTAANVTTALAAGQPGAFSTLSASGVVSGAGFTTLLAPYQTSAQVISAIAAGNPGAFSTLSASSTVSGTGFSTYLASPPAIGGTTPATGKFTTVQSTIVTGTAPLTVASTTNVANLNASSLNGATFAAPGAIGGTTAGAGTFTTLNATSTTTLAAMTSTGITASPISGSTGSFTTLAASSTVSGTGFSTYLASPPAIGGTAAAAGAFTTLTASSSATVIGTTQVGSSAGTGVIQLAGASTQARSLQYFTGTSANAMRWAVGLINGAETGGNVNGDLAFARFDDTGAFLGNSIVVTRATGVVTVAGSVSLTAATTLTADNLRANGTTALSLGTTTNGEVLRLNDLGAAQTSRMDVSFTSGTNTWVLGPAGGTGTNFMLTSVGSGSVLLRANAGTQFGTGTVGSAVNFLTASGSTGTSPPILTATGPATNLDILLTPKGTGLTRSSAGLGVGGATGPTWTTGAGVPAATQPIGSIYSNTSGAVGARLYVSAGGGTWAAVTGV